MVRGGRERAVKRTGADGPGQAHYDGTLGTEGTRPSHAGVHLWSGGPMDDRLPLMTTADLCETVLRLQAAGIVATFRLEAGSAPGWITWTDAYLRLLTAGRHPDREPGMVAAWATGDPAIVRQWIEREAAALPRGPDPSRG